MDRCIMALHLTGTANQKSIVSANITLFASRQPRYRHTHLLFVLVVRNIQSNSWIECNIPFHFVLPKNIIIPTQTRHLMHTVIRHSIRAKCKQPLVSQLEVTPRHPILFVTICSVCSDIVFITMCRAHARCQDYYLT